VLCCHTGISAAAEKRSCCDRGRGTKPNSSLTIETLQLYEAEELQAVDVRPHLAMGKNNFLPN